MRLLRTALPGLVLTLALACAACQTAPPTKKGLVAAPSPVVIASESLEGAVIVKQLGNAIDLTGKVKLITDNGGGIVSDNGGGVISNNGGSLISNNGGSIVTINGGSAISNNGGALLGKDPARWLLGGPRAESLLADAVIRIYDASGHALVDAAGKPLGGTSDKHGHFAMHVVLPPQNLVLGVTLFKGGALPGGQLKAILPKSSLDKLEQSIDTASSLGAAYVLGQYVNGVQAVFDKLPAAAVAELQTRMAAARQGVAAPAFTQQGLTQQVETLRARSLPLDQTLAVIKSLLLGQPALGNGFRATDVAISDPTSLSPDGKGGFYVGEYYLGRIRHVLADGTQSTLMGSVRGKLKHNYGLLDDFTLAADGTLYLTTDKSVARVTTDDTATFFTGDTSHPLGDVPVLRHPRVALDAHGTLYVTSAPDGGRGEIITYGADGVGHRLDFGASGPPGPISGMTFGPDGALYLLSLPSPDVGCVIDRFTPGAGLERVLEGLSPDALALCVGSDGTMYFTEAGAHRIRAALPNGPVRIVAGEGGPAGTQALLAPHALALGLDDTLYVSDTRTNLVYRLDKQGGWSVGAGTTALTGGGAFKNLTLNGPSSGIYMSDGSLVIAETGGNQLVKFDGNAFLPFAGGDGKLGFGGDGGPATAAGLQGPTSPVTRDGTVYFLDRRNHRLRAVSPDGMIRTVLGGGKTVTLGAGERVAADQIDVVNAGALAIDAAGRLYWSTTFGQVLRQATDGMIELVAGQAHTRGGSATASEFLVKPHGDGGPAKDGLFLAPGGMAFDAKGDLYVPDTGAFCVRKITGLNTDTPMLSTFAGASIAQTISGSTTPPNEEGIDASAARLFLPIAVIFDAVGNCYVNEVGTLAIPVLTAATDFNLGLQIGLPESFARIRKIAPDHTITTVAGHGGRYFTDPVAEDALVAPAGLAIGLDGRLAVMDVGANLVRVLPAGSF